MAAVASSTKSDKVFYGWWIVLLCSLLTTYGAGIFYYGFSTFVKPIVMELGWSVTVISGAFSLYRLEAGVAAPVIGFLLDRIGPRKLVFWGGVVMGCGIIFLSRVQTVFPFYAAIIVISLGYSAFAGTAMGNPLIGKWFVKKRGKALGIFAAVRGLAGLLVPGVAYLIVLFGWRTALLILGPLTWIVVLPLALALKQSPEKCALLPDGEASENPVAVKKEIKKATISEVDFSLKQAMLTPALWILTVCLFSHQATQAAVFVHLVPYLIDLGIKPTSAATMVTFVAVASVFGRYGFGWLSDHLNKKWLLFTLYLLQPIGILFLIRVQHVPDVIPFVLIYSTAYGGNSVVKAVTTADYFGRKNFGTIYGVIQGISTFGSIAGPLIAGMVYDIKGSYRMAFVAFAVMMGCTALLVMFLRPPVWRDRSIRRQPETLTNRSVSGQ